MEKAGKKKKTLGEKRLQAFMSGPRAPKRPDYKEWVKQFLVDKGKRHAVSNVTRRK